MNVYRGRRRSSGAVEAPIEAAVSEELQAARSIAANMADGVALIRAEDGVIIFTNPSWDEMFGYAPGEMQGRHVSLVHAPTDQTPEERAGEMLAALQHGRSWRGAVHNVRKDGTHFWSEAGVSEYFHPVHGRVWVAMHRETTQRMAEDANLRAAAERYRSVFDRSPAATIILTEDLRLADVNDAFCSLVGCSPEDVLGKPLADLTEPDDAGLDQSFFTDLFASGDLPRSASRRYVGRGGATIPVTVDAVVVAGIDGRPPYAIAAIRPRDRGR